jgi:hypothetical protein
MSSTLKEAIDFSTNVNASQVNGAADKTDEFNREQLKK